MHIVKYTYIKIGYTHLARFVDILFLLNRKSSCIKQLLDFRIVT